MSITYKRGIVYKLIHTQSNITYIGSTFDTTRGRLPYHKKSYELYLKNKTNEIEIYKYFDKYGTDNFKIISIKQYDCVDKQQLEAYQQLYINKLKPINTTYPLQFNFISYEEYLEKYITTINNPKEKPSFSFKKVISKSFDREALISYKINLTPAERKKESRIYKQFLYTEPNNYCQVCNKNYGDGYKRHLKTQKHRKNIADRDLDLFLKGLPNDF